MHAIVFMSLHSLIHKHLRKSNVPTEFGIFYALFFFFFLQLLNWPEVEYIFYLQVELLHNENFIYEYIKF